MTRASTARGSGELVVAMSSALAIVTIQVKFASSKQMRSLVLSDRELGYPVNASDLTEHKARLLCSSDLLYGRAVSVRIHCCRSKGECTMYQKFKFSMSQGWHWCHTITNTFHGQWSPMEPHAESYAPSL